jgi:hypothetical protein
MAHKSEDGSVEARHVMNLRSTIMENDVVISVTQVRRPEIPDDIPSVAVTVDPDPDDPDAERDANIVLTIYEAAFLLQGLQLVVQEILGLYAEAQSDDLALKTMDSKGGWVNE